MRALLMPGLDGTATLFGPLEDALPRDWRIERVAYPPDRPLGYDELETLLRARIAVRDEPTLLVAESFSGPLAIRLAANPPPNVCAVVLAATFARSPMPRAFRFLASPTLFSAPPSPAALRFTAVGADAPPALIDAIRAAMERVAPEVLAHRLREIFEVDVRAELASVRLPVLAIRPRRDNLLRRDLLGPYLPTHARRISVDSPHLVLQRAAGACAIEIVALASRAS